MVTYLKLRVQRVEDLVKFPNKGVSTLSECLHHLSRILVSIRDLGAPRTTFLSTEGILSRSFSLGIGGGGLDKWTFARQAVRQLGTITRAGDPQPIGLKSSPYWDDGGARSGCRGESCRPPPSKASSGVNLELGGGELAAKIVIQR